MMKIGSAITLLFVLSWVAFPTKLSPKKAINLPVDDPMGNLNPGPGLKTVQAYCGICHSTDYIVRQPREGARAWQAEVAKMITVYGAPIPKADAQVIAKYLAFAYGVKSSRKGQQTNVQ